MKTLNRYDKFTSVIARSKLFAGIPTDDYNQVLRFLDASIRSYAKGEVIHGIGEPLKYAGLVLEGTVEGYFTSENYNKIRMDNFTKGRSFAEAFSCAHAPYSPIELGALSDCTVLFLNLSKVLEGGEVCDYQQVLANNVIRVLASKSVFSHLKLRIASQRSLRDKIMVYFHSLVPDADGYIHVPFTQTAMAEFLGVNRSALSRELGNMQHENLIHVDGKHIKLK